MSLYLSNFKVRHVPAEALKDTWPPNIENTGTQSILCHTGLPADSTASLTSVPPPSFLPPPVFSPTWPPQSRRRRRRRRTNHSSSSLSENKGLYIMIPEICASNGMSVVHGKASALALYIQRFIRLEMNCQSRSSRQDMIVPLPASADTLARPSTRVG